MKQIILTTLFAVATIINIQAQEEASITVYGACGMCGDRIEETARSLQGVRGVTYDLESNTLKFKYYPEKIDIMQVHRAMADAGHDTDKVKADDEVYSALPLCCLYRQYTSEPETEPSGDDPDFKRSPLINGTIFEEDAEGNKVPLIGANIQWLGAPMGGTTDAEGHFEIGRIKMTDLLVITYVGYPSDTIDVSSTNEVEWTMTEGIRLDEVEVTYKKKTTTISYLNPVQVKNLGEEELCKAACCSLSESFETSPSIDASFTDAVTGTRQIQMLGLAGKYVQITRELVPDVRSLAVIDGLEYTPGAWIESIQLSKGSGSVAQGYESMTGQINVELRKPEKKERFYLNLYANEGGRYEGNLTLKQKVSSNWSTALLLHGKTQYQRHDRNDDGFLDMPLGQNFFATNRWKYQDASGLQGQIGLRYVDKSTFSGQQRYQPDLDEGSTDIWGFQKEAEVMEVWAKIGKYLNPINNSSFGFMISAKQYEDNRIYGQRRYDVEEQNLYSNFLYEIGTRDKAHHFKMGASYVLDMVVEDFGSLGFDYEEHIVGGFLEYTYAYEDKFTAVLGQRLDHHNNFGLQYIPRLHLRYAVSDRSVFRGSVGRGWRSARVLVENVGLMASNRSFEVRETEENSPYGLLPEQNWNMGANWTYTFYTGPREGVLALDYYHAIFTDQIVADFESASDGTVILTNQADQTTAHSLQAQLDYEVFKNFDIRAAYRYNISWADYGGEEKTIPFNSFHRAFVNMAYEARDGWHFDLTVNWNGEQRLPSTAWMAESNRIEEESEAFFMVMAQVRKIFNKNFELYAGVENMFNFRVDNPIVSANDPFGSDFDASLVWGPIFGRNIYTGLRYRFD
jgi:outer membrane receptor for ferrienterochelin and colicin/copper chaperone CopZ